jgi:hypothetical protein
MTSMTSEALRAAPYIWKRPNLPPGVSKDDKKIDIAKIQVNGFDVIIVPMSMSM